MYTTIIIILVVALFMLQFNNVVSFTLRKVFNVFNEKELQQLAKDILNEYEQNDVNAKVTDWVGGRPNDRK